MKITAFAGVAQSVVQLIRNQQVVCSSHITSSNTKGRHKPPFCIGAGVLTYEEHLECEALDGLRKIRLDY